MSEENVELVRRIYEEGLIHQDPERLVDELGTPDIEYVNPPYAVEPGVRHGPAEVARALRRAHELFTSPRYVVHELFDAGGAVVGFLVGFGFPKAVKMLLKVGLPIAAITFAAKKYAGRNGDDYFTRT